MQLNKQEFFTDTTYSGADPGFPVGGGANLRFCQNFPKNCMKLQKFWVVGGRAGSAPP